MGEIVDLERYRKQRKRQRPEAKPAKAAKLGGRRGGAAPKRGSTPATVERAETGGPGPEDTVKTDDEHNTD